MTVLGSSALRVEEFQRFAQSRERGSEPLAGQVGCWWLVGLCKQSFLTW